MKEKIQPLRRILGIATAIALAAAGICLMVACFGIYQSGSFTPQKVGDAFQPIAIPVYLSLGLAVLGLLLQLAAPEGAEKPKSLRQTALLLSRLQAKGDLGSAEPELVRAIAAQQQRRKHLHLMRAGVLTVCALFFAVYALNGSHFTTDINASMIRAMAVGLPCLLLCLSVFLAVRWLCSTCMEREIALWKQVPSGKMPEKASPAPQKRAWVRWAVLGVAAAALILGYCTGGTVDVLTKAVNICTECVGLG